MRLIDKFLAQYGESHQNVTNKLIHWLCVPAIIFSLAGMLFSIPFPFGEKTLWMNWTSVVFVLAIIYYLRLSIPLAIGFVIVAALVLWGNFTLFRFLGSSLYLFYASIGIFVVAWIGQFIGHEIEGKKPSFLTDVKFLLIGPAWLLHFIYKKLGISY